MADVHRLRGEGISPAAVARGVTQVDRDDAPFVDLLVVSGDVFGEGAPREVEPALAYLRELCRELAVPRQEVLLAPGGGDVGLALAELDERRAELEGDPPGGPGHPFVVKWRSLAQLHEALAGDAIVPRFEPATDRPWQVLTVRQLGVAAMALNSVRRRDHRHPDRIGLGSDQLNEAHHYLAEPNTSDFLRVAAMAHHPDQLPDQGAEGAALEALLDREVDLLLVGSVSEESTESPDPASPSARSARVVAAGPRPGGATPVVNHLMVTDHEIEVQPLYYDLGTGTFHPTTDPGPRMIARHRRSDGDRGSERSRPHRRRHRGQGIEDRGVAHSRELTDRLGVADVINVAGDLDRLDAAGDLDRFDPVDSSGQGPLGGPDGDLHLAGPHLPTELARSIKQATEHHHGDAVVEWRAAGYLVVTRSEGRNRFQYPIKPVEGTPADADLDDFATVVRDFRAMYGGGLVTPLMVHAGPVGDEGLGRRAFRAGVELISLSRYLGVIDFTSYLQRLRGRLDRDDDYASRLYLQQRFDLLIGSLPGEAAHPALIERLQSPEGGIYVVLGQAGAGKTFLLRQLARTLSQPEPDGGAPVVTPLLVSLRQLLRATPTLDGILASHLAENRAGGHDPRAIDYLVRAGRIALLFDGYDEFANKVTFSAAERQLRVLLDTASENTKIVITSRTSHFAHRDDVSKVLRYTPQGEIVRDRPQATLVELQPFDRGEILDYLGRYYGDEEAATERLKRMDELRDLAGLATTPRFLSAIAALPERLLGRAEGPDGQASAYHLYETLVGQWLEGEVRRRRDVADGPDITTLTDRERTDVDELHELMEELALTLWRRGASTLSRAELESQVADQLRELAGTEASRVRAQQVGSGSLLVADDGRFGFIHPSIGEWLISRRLAAFIAAGDRPAQAQLLAEQRLTELVVDPFLGDALGSVALGRWVDEMQGDEGVGASTTARDNLRKLGETTGGQSGEGVGRSYRGLDLSAQRFSGDLRNADFEDGLLDQAVFEGADLRGARFADASLRSARFVPVDGRPTRLDGVDFTGADLTAAVLVPGRGGIPAATFEGAGSTQNRVGRGFRIG